MSIRLVQLEEFYREDPNDPFNLYALALEYQKTNVEKSRELFNELLATHEDYIPAYYHAAQLYLSLNNTEHAIVILEKGIPKARTKNETKAARELQTLLDELTL
jgi:tetratricopeptide (TPR) repeat protein